MGEIIPLACCWIAIVSVYLDSVEHLPALNLMEPVLVKLSFQVI